jgi:nucleoside-diphosphate-sugar epimerase
MTMGKHVVAGAGQVGSLVARQLLEQGHEVVVVSRSGSGPDGAQRHVADVADRDALTNITQGADALYNCVNPPYHHWQQDWPAMADSLLAAAESSGAVYAILGNLYIYGPADGPMIESAPLNPSSDKAQVRVNMWQQALAAHDAGRVRVTEVRGSDYFGPGCRDQSHLGERFVPRMLAGKPARFVVNTRTPHSWSYVPDVARTIVVAATDERAWGRAWHVPTSPPLSVRELADRMCAVAGLPNPGVTSMPSWLVRALGTVSPMLGEIEAIRYQFDRPFVIDSSDFETTFGIAPTAMDEALAATIDWWRELDRTHV